MTFDEFVRNGWQDHVEDPEGVFARLPGGVRLVTEPRHLPAFAGLVVHVAGEHLGRWADGIALFESVAGLPVFDPASPEGKGLRRAQAVLHRCAGDSQAEARCLAAGRSGGDLPEASDRIRVLATAAAALIAQKRLADGRRDFEEAVALAAYGPTKSDPAARALAVTANNLAAALEERPTLSPDERGLMLRAAEVARRFWGIAGGWQEAERAEYRLAQSHVKAGDAPAALRHAKACLAIVSANGNDAGEAFFGHEAMARAHLAAGNRAAARSERETMAALLPTIVDDGFRVSCGEDLSKLDALLSPP